MKCSVHDEAEMLALGGSLAVACHNPMVIYLHGQLGAGKTTLVRGFMRGMGYKGAVKSPTYTLIEPYQLGQWRLHHLDLYRVQAAAELAYLGLRELHDGKVIMLVEWPERGEGLLPPADLVLNIEYAMVGREITLTPLTAVGEALVNGLAGADFSSD
jgi:tRNA threonylcarbamoyladenosine biosynthesis protein TsaE